MGMSNSTKDLIDRGVRILAPETVEIAPSVLVDRISPDATIHPGCRLRGETLSIGPGCVIGEEAPATVVDCQLEKDVSLKGGYFEGAVFLQGSSVGSAAHVRPGTLLEEQASGAHAVGLKQTILMSYVTAGSLINFCDALMGGGTDRRNHSEIGSSYIHFNYTPHQDKATASLIGDVPRSVMLDQPPIFLGGQGGLVGPARITFGCVLPAGTICRRDALNEGQLVLQPAVRARGERDYVSGLYGDVDRVVANCLHYIGNILALKTWYVEARRPFMEGRAFSRACYEGAVKQLDAVLQERIKRLGDLAGKMPQSLALAKDAGVSDHVRASQECLSVQWPAMHQQLLALAQSVDVDGNGKKCLAELHKCADKAYLDAIRSLGPEDKSKGTVWLQSIVHTVVGMWGIQALNKD